jgi:replicative DNA helicase
MTDLDLVAAISDHETECQAIASMIYDQDCLEKGLTLTPDHFTNTTAKKILACLKQLHQENIPTGPVAVYDKLKNSGEMFNTEFAIIKDVFCTKLNFDHYLFRLGELLKARRLYQITEQIKRGIIERENIDSILTTVENQIYSLGTSRQDYHIVTPKERAERILDTVAKRMEKKSNGGISTSYLKLNRCLNGGALPGQLIIIAAKTGKGKTAFALNLNRDIAITQKIPSLYVNTEMGEEQIDVREAAILTAGTGITHYDLASGNLTNEQFQRLANELNRTHNGGFYSVTVPDLTINSLLSIARRFKAKIDMKLLTVDYVGRMETQDPKLQEWQVLKTIAKRLKTLAQQLQVTVIMLAQMTDEERLEGARAMKNECDLFGYLREMTPEESAAMLNSYNYVLVVDKNRDGPTGKIPLKFNGETMTFIGESLEEVKRALANGQPQTQGNNPVSTTKGNIYQNSPKRGSQHRPYED